ncbi:hypothetical protein VTJ04DRAFT_266 [Mycothermus thermophilus]|uniref:uncharacterized protein n=1 Tax=Humicola insolens TaxID=85995 RepID=UPI003743BC40
MCWWWFEFSHGCRLEMSVVVYDFSIWHFRMEGCGLVWDELLRLSPTGSMRSMITRTHYPNDDIAKKSIQIAAHRLVNEPH